MGSNPLISESPDPDDLHRLEEAIYEFNVQATGISDGKLFASFLRDADKGLIGGISGWATAFTRERTFQKRATSFGRPLTTPAGHVAPYPRSKTV